MKNLIGILSFGSIAGLALISACSPPVPPENGGWKETAPPRPDLQCWQRWGRQESTVCAPSLTSTHGASK